VQAAIESGCVRSDELVAAVGREHGEALLKGCCGRRNGGCGEPFPLPERDLNGEPGSTDNADDVWNTVYDTIDAGPTSSIETVAAVRRAHGQRGVALLLEEIGRIAGVVAKEIIVATGRETGTERRGLK
jgi:hypothetical protein